MRDFLAENENGTAQTDQKNNDPADNTKPKVYLIKETPKKLKTHNT
jgi:hypothetical protein